MFMVCPVRNIGAVVAPSVTPVAQKSETTGGTGATTGVLGREAVFVTPFRRAGVTSGALTYHVCNFSAWCDMQAYQAFGLP